MKPLSPEQLYSPCDPAQFGFATTAEAYRDFLAHQGLADRISAALESLDVEDVTALAATMLRPGSIRMWRMP